MAIDNRTDNRGWPLPAPGNKLRDDVLRLIAAFVAADADVAALISDVAGKADADHSHTIAAITGLAAALAGKMDTGFHDSLDGLTDVSVAGASVGQVLMRQAMAWIPVALQVNHVANLESLLNGKATPADIAALKNEILGGAGAAFDTLGELAAMLGNDPNFATSMANALAKRLRVDAATAFTEAEKIQGRSNLGAASAADMSGAIRKDVVQALTAAEIVRMLGNTKQAWEHISTTTLTSPQASLLFTGLGAYRELRLAYVFAPTVQSSLQIRFGNASIDAGTNYEQSYMYNRGDSFNGVGLSAQSSMLLAYTGDGLASSNWPSGSMHITNFNPNVAAVMHGLAYSRTSGSPIAAGTLIGLHASSTPLTMLQMFAASGNIGAGTRITLEGIRG